MVSATFSRGVDYIQTVGRDGTVRLMYTKREFLYSLAKSRVTRKLTLKERGQYRVGRELTEDEREYYREHPE